MKDKPHTFEHFPPDKTCPVCGTNEDGETVLIEIDGTLDEAGKLCEAECVHLWCAIAERYNRELKCLYTKR